MQSLENSATKREVRRKSGPAPCAGSDIKRYLSICELATAIRPAGISGVRFPSGQLASGGVCRSCLPLAGVQPMRDNQNNDGKSTDSNAGGFTNTHDNEKSRATESQNAGGESVAGCPAQRSVRNGTYQTQRHNFSARAASSGERVPSAGWREVYFAMGVHER